MFIRFTVCVIGSLCWRPALPPALMSAAWLQGVEAFQQAGHALLQRVQGVMLGVMATETAPQTAQGIPDKLQLLCHPVGGPWGGRRGHCVGVSIYAVGQ
ncbi:hypothetical protein AAFF_G00117830 [Aldrovandia affinis]|uniref:Secreted protein n=1 Tax=Aldrovandia affinis TaxID=143900 RepID=A0AAD7T1V4_9TELE|nr:hypothetical protein AAFF_G00117830 [Aldrovandia affinis]